MTRLRWHHRNFTHFIFLSGEFVHPNVSLVYILLNNKTKEIYTLIFKVIEQKTRNIIFQSLVVYLKDAVF
jgi:hypothetical protein